MFTKAYISKTSVGVKGLALASVDGDENTFCDQRGEVFALLSQRRRLTEETVAAAASHRAFSWNRDLVENHRIPIMALLFFEI